MELNQQPPAYETGELPMLIAAIKTRQHSCTSSLCGTKIGVNFGKEDLTYTAFLKCSTILIMPVFFAIFGIQSGLNWGVNGSKTGGDIKRRVKIAFNAVFKIISPLSGSAFIYVIIHANRHPAFFITVLVNQYILVAFN